MKRIKLLILLSLISTLTFGQTPKLTGTVKINLNEGLIFCDFILTDFPVMDNPAFCLNKGFNIKDIKQNGKSVGYNVDWGVAFKTSFLREGIGIAPIIDTLTTSTKISLSYVGAFPIYKANETVKNGDGMSVIAIKDDILRASHQTLWYPVLIDRTTNTIFTKVTYHINIECNDCNSIYLGGSNPKKTKKSEFASTIPNDLMLYVGKYGFSKSGNTFFLNSDLDETQEETIDNALDKIRQFYSKIIKLDYSEPIVLAQIFSIGPKDQYEKWAFVVYPCIVADLKELPKQINNQTKEISDINAFRIYSHELAHQYFGLKVKSDNEYWGFYSESFAEYLCLKAIEETFSKKDYIEFIRHRYLNKKALSKKYIHLDKVVSEIDNNHKYNYYPMLLLGLEQIVGQTRMFAFLKYIVHNTVLTNLNYETLKKKAIESGITEQNWLEFENTYVNTNNCLEIVKNRLLKDF